MCTIGAWEFWRQRHPIMDISALYYLLCVDSAIVIHVRTLGIGILWFLSGVLACHVRWVIIIVVVWECHAKEMIENSLKFPASVLERLDLFSVRCFHRTHSQLSDTDVCSCIHVFQKYIIWKI